jgi:hypothetical protein
MDRAQDRLRLAQAERDLELIAIVEEANLPVEQRRPARDLARPPVPDEILVNTRTKRDQVRHQSTRFAETVGAETEWLSLMAYRGSCDPRQDCRARPIEPWTEGC